MTQSSVCHEGVCTSGVASQATAASAPTVSRSAPAVVPGLATAGFAPSRMPAGSSFPGAALAARRPLRPSQVPFGSVGKDGADGPRYTSPILEVVGRGGGQPLDPAVRADMEARLGSDFSDVRVHTGDKAARSAAAVSAAAYTMGSEVVFGQGSFDPASPAGRQRLAHELVHVQQQRQGPVSGTDSGGGVAISDPADSFEREAEATAARVASGPPLRAPGDLPGPRSDAKIPARFPMRTPAGLLQLQRTAGNRSVQRWLSTDISDFTEVTHTEQYHLNASIPVARAAADDPGAADLSAAQDGGAATDGVPDAVSVGPEDATEDVEPTMIQADAIASQLGYTTSVTPQQGDPTDKTEFGFTWGSHVQTAPGGRIHHDKPSSTWQVSQTYDNPVTFRVFTSAGPRGQKDIGGPDDPKIKKGNFAQVAADLTPGPDGRPPRNQFWSRDLTIAHELFHARDGQNFCRQAVAHEQQQLNTQQAATMDDVQALMHPIPMRIITARGTGMANGGEARAYAAGKAAYQNRADTIRGNGKANKYTALEDSGEPDNALASDDTIETNGSAADQSGTASA